MSKEKSARIANTPDAGKKGGQASPYEEWTVDKPQEQAQKVGIEGRSKMNKVRLIEAMRNDRDIEYRFMKSSIMMRSYICLSIHL